MAVAIGAGLRMQPGRVLVRPEFDEGWGRSGLYIPDTAREAPQRGVVVAIGSKRGAQRESVGSELKEGDIVLFGRYSGTSVYFEGEELLILYESDILAVLVQENPTDFQSQAPSTPIETLPVLIFLSEDDHGAERRIRNAVEKIGEFIGFEITDEQPAVRGSILKKFMLSARGVVPTNEPKRSLEVIERALIARSANEIPPALGKSEADAVAALLGAVALTPNAVLMIGSLLVLKITDPIYGERIVAKTLSNSQAAFLDNHPKLWTDPAAMLAQIEAVSEVAITQRKFPV